MQMKDSGQRETFATGAQRDGGNDKPRPDLISPFSLRRIGVWLGIGAKKYKERNWEAGMPFSRVMASLERHLVAYKAGETDEDHLAAIGCNVTFLLHYEECIKLGLLPKGLDDMPKYAQRAAEAAPPLFDKDKPATKAGGAT